MRNPLHLPHHAPALVAAIALSCLGLSSGCGSSTSPGTAHDTTVIAPKLTLADSLADHSIPYQDHDGKWVVRKGEGFALRQPENFEEAHNLEGGYVWVLQLPPVARR